jgi:hypothetical protein
MQKLPVSPKTRQVWPLVNVLALHVHDVIPKRPEDWRAADSSCQRAAGTPRRYSSTVAVMHPQNSGQFCCLCTTQIDCP